MAVFSGATPRTIDNYSIHQRRWGRIETEQLLQLPALCIKGKEVFSSSEAFNEGLGQPALGLGGIICFDLLYTAGDNNFVMEELLRIEYGALP